MSEFDPGKPARVHDRLNGKVLDWRPSAFAAHYRRYACDFGDGVVEWDGLLLDGWLPSLKWSWRKIALGATLVLFAILAAWFGGWIGAAFGAWLAWPVAQELAKRWG